MPNLTVISAGVNSVVSRSRCVVRCATVVALLTLAVCCTGGAAAQDAATASTAPPSLSVVYDASTDLVSIDSHDTPLHQILEELSRPAVLTVELLEPIPDQLVSVEIHELSLEEAIRQLVGEVPFTIAYVSGVDVINAVLRGDAPQVIRTATALEQRRSAAEKVWAVDNLLVLATDQQVSTRSAAVGALRILAPGAAVTLLVDMLDNDPDPAVQATAARELARLGGDDANSALLEVFADGRAALHKTVADALVSEGDAAARAALAEVIIEERITPEAVSDVLIRALALSAQGKRFTIATKR